MAVRDPPQRAQHPLLVCLRRLSDELDAVALDGGQPFPRSPIFLPQFRVEGDRQTEPLAEDLRRLARAGGSLE
jgi:hypothetical protein